MAPETNYVLIAPDDPCPCRSGKATSDCCMEADGSFRVKFPSPLPPGPGTGFSNPTCFMRRTHNCSKDISTDPYMSKNVLDMFGTKAINASLIWNGGETEPLGIENLTSQIACNRHNGALAPLDSVAIQAFENFLDATVYAIRKSLVTKNVHYAASGEGLELWALKLLFGVHAAMAAGDADRLKDTEPLDIGVFQRALERGPLARPCGLYLKRTGGQPGNPVGCEPQAAQAGNRIRGLRFAVAALEFALIVDPSGVDFAAVRRQYYYRPSSIDLAGKRRSANIFLSGSTFGTNEGARFTFLETHGE